MDPENPGDLSLTHAFIDQLKRVLCLGRVYCCAVPPIPPSSRALAAAGISLEYFPILSVAVVSLEKR
jgi:hypothetical protein